MQTRQRWQHPRPPALSSAHVTQMVGISAVYLNALVHRKLYGIAASISDGLPGIKVRIFSKEDVLGIALVWTLFEAGLRPQPIKDILRSLAETKKPDAVAAAHFLLSSEVEYLVVACEQDRSKRKARLKLWVEPTTTRDLVGRVTDRTAKHPAANILLVPIGEKLLDVEMQIKAMFRE
jgi:hypothetical protein